MIHIEALHVAPTLLLGFDLRGLVGDATRLSCVGTYIDNVINSILHHKLPQVVNGARCQVSRLRFLFLFVFDRHEVDLAIRLLLSILAQRI